MRRGDVVEAVHRVHVATTDGERWGEELPLLLRSSAKPIQAIPFVEGYDDLDDDEIAIACASHHAEPAQLAAVRKVLARAGATVDDLENGLQECRPDGKLGHNCSGQARGHARRVRGQRLAAASVPRSLASAAAADRRADRRRRDRGRRLRRADVREDARAARPSCSRTRRRGSAVRCARGPSWSARRATHPTPI